MRLNKRKKLDWYDLWINKSNYITSYYDSIKGKYKTIDESIDYYIVMLEFGIFLLKDYSYYFDYVYIQHNIIIDEKVYFKEDIKERDFSEYLKYLFYYDYDIQYVFDLISKYSNRFNYYLVGIRLLFPSYYLFYFDRVIIENRDYNKLCEIVNRTSDYEKYIKKIVNKLNEYLSKKIVLPF